MLNNIGFHYTKNFPMKNNKHIPINPTLPRSISAKLSKQLTAFIVDAPLILTTSHVQQMLNTKRDGDGRPGTTRFTSGNNSYSLQAFPLSGGEIGMTLTLTVSGTSRSLYHFYYSLMFYHKEKKVTYSLLRVCFYDSQRRRRDLYLANPSQLNESAESFYLPGGLR